MLHSLWRILTLMFLIINAITAYDEDISVEIEGMSNFFNPLNWFGEDKTVSDAPEREDIPVIDLGPETRYAPEPEPALETNANAASPSDLASPSGSLNERESPQANSGSEVRIEGAPLNSPAPSPIDLSRGVQLMAREKSNNNGEGGLGRSANSNYRSPGGAQPYGSPAYGSPAYGNSPYGSSPYGNSPYGNSPYGPLAHGSSAFGNSPYGNPYGGANSYLNLPSGRAPQPNRYNRPDRTMYRSRSNKRRAVKPNEQPGQ